MNPNERILVLLLRLGGAFMLMALGAVVMPFEWMNSIHAQMGLGELPHVPIVSYLNRSISALYALHGALLLFVAGDVHRYLPIVRFLAVAGALFGAVMLVIDCTVGMPLFWTVGEGPFIVTLNVLVLWFSGRRYFPPPVAIK